MRSRNARGFSLIELLVVIAILSVVTTLGTVTLFQLWSRWGELKTSSGMDRRANRAFESMRADLASAVASNIAGVALQGTTGTDKSPLYYEMPLENDQFTLPVEAPIDGGKATAIAGYRIEREGDESVLVRTSKLLRSGTELPGKTIAEGVVKMRVEYADAGSEWSQTWTKPVNPKAVRVTLLLAEPGHPNRQQSVRQAEFTVNVP